MRIAPLLLLLLFPVGVLAGDVTVSWTPPVREQSCVDAGELTDLAGFRLYKLVEDIADPTITTFTETGVSVGTHIYTATAYTSTGAESVLTQPAEKVVTTFVTTATLVFYPVAQPNGMLLLGIGNVPLGTPCNQDLEVKGHYAVDRALVNWAGTAEPLLVVAQCG